jgi:sugar phosphate isomerase/epimerase
VAAKIVFSVFTKPWPMLSLPALGKFVSELGLDGVELPVRPKFQVVPENVMDLPRVAKILAEFGVRIYSVAGPTDEATMAACAEAGVSTIRVMAGIGPAEDYLEAEDRLRREYDSLLPLLEAYGVRLGVQNHYGRFVANALGLRRILEHYDPKHIGAVWDAGHEALEGTAPDLALDAIWSHLCMVNLKNAYWKRTTGPEAVYAEWSVYWTTGQHGLASWPRVIQELKEREYDGVVCLTAEYSDKGAADRLVASDLAYVRTLL